VPAVIDDDERGLAGCQVDRGSVRRRRRRRPRRQQATCLLHQSSWSVVNGETGPLLPHGVDDDRNGCEHDGCHYPREQPAGWHSALVHRYDPR